MRKVLVALGMLSQVSFATALCESFRINDSFSFTDHYRDVPLLSVSDVTMDASINFEEVAVEQKRARNDLPPVRRMRLSELTSKERIDDIKEREMITALTKELLEKDALLQRLIEEGKKRDEEIERLTLELKQQKEEDRKLIEKQREEDRKRQEEDRKRQEMENAKHNEEMSLVFKMLSEMQAAQKPQNPDEKK